MNKIETRCMLLCLILLLTVSPLRAQTTWSPCTGPYGGLINDLAVNSQGGLFAATPSGIFRSINNGNTWAACSIYTTDKSSVLAVYALPNSVLVAGMDAGIILRSSNGGTTWNPVDTLAGEGTISAFASDTGNVYMAVHSTSAGIGGVFRSTDDGLTWTAVSNGLTKDIYALTVNPVTNTILASSYSGIYRSVNAGNSWTGSNSGISQPYKFIPSMTASAGGMLFAAAYSYKDNSTGLISGGVYLSTDDGVTWQPTATGLADQNMMRVSMSPKNILYASNQNGHIQSSSNNGANWTISDSVGASVLCFAHHLTLGTSYIGTGRGFFRTVNRGTTWVSASDGILNSNVTSLLRDTSSTVYCGTSVASRVGFGTGSANLSMKIFGGGVYRSTDDGDHWSMPVSADSVYDIRVLTRTPQGNIFALSDWGDLLKTTDHSASWHRINTGYNIITAYAMVSNDSGHIFVGTYHNPTPNYFRWDLVRSNDGGATWFTTLKDYNPGSLAVGNNRTIYAGGSAGIYRSTDNGYGWVHTNNPPGTPNIVSLTYNRANDRLYAGTLRSLALTSNGGNSWNKLDSTTQNCSIWSLYAAGDTLVSSSDVNGVRLCFNNGGAWMAAGTGLDGKTVQAMIADKTGKVLAGTTGGVYRSGAFVPVTLTTFIANVLRHDVTLLWRTAGETNNHGFEIQRYTSDGDWRSVAFVNGNGTTNAPRDYTYHDADLLPGRYAYRLKQIDTDGRTTLSSSIEVEISATEASFTLCRNYPNPFSDRTVFELHSGAGDLPASDVKNALSVRVFRILDSYGRVVLDLSDEMNRASTITLDGSRLPGSGVYLWQLRIGEQTHTGRLVYLR